MLSCTCNNDDYSYYYECPDDFSIYENSQAMHCKNCNEQTLIKKGDTVLIIKIFNFDENGEVELGPDHIMCESCGEICLNLENYGYCFDIYKIMKDLLKRHWENTGYFPKEGI